MADGSGLATGLGSRGSRFRIGGIWRDRPCRCSVTRSLLARSNGIHIPGTAMNSPELLALRLVHIIMGVLWVGTAVFIAAFVLPSVRALGSTGGQFMQQLVQVRHLPRYLLIVSWTTVVSGVLLYWRYSAGFQPAWVTSPVGITLGMGGGAGIAVALMGVFVNLPTARRLSAIGSHIQASGGPPSAELQAEVQRLQRRLVVASQVAAALLLFSAAAMAVGWHVRW